MKITRSNYESWFLEFLEGDLDPEMADEFQLFLSRHPDLARELETGDVIKLLSDMSIQYGPKDQLKKAATEPFTEFQNLAVAYHEGDLPAAERLSFEASLSENALLAAESEKIGMLKLRPDQTVVYDQKDQLKRRGILIPFWMKATLAAAVLFIAYLIYQPENKSYIQNEFAGVRDQIPVNSVPSAEKARVAEKKATLPKPVSVPAKGPSATPIRQRLVPAAEKGRKNAETAPSLRTPEPEPALLKPRGIYFGQPEEIQLAAITLKNRAPLGGEQQLSELLKDHLAAMREEDDRDFLSTERLELAGLQLFAKITGKRLTARKGNDGTVKSVSYNSHLLAFSIPVNR